MSRSDAVAFVQKLIGDAELMKQAVAAPKEDVARMGSEMGLTFEHEELQDVLNAVINGELLEEDLESVSGGGSLSNASKARHDIAFVALGDILQNFRAA